MNAIHKFDESVLDSAKEGIKYHGDQNDYFKSKPHRNMPVVDYPATIAYLRAHGAKTARELAGK